MADFIINSTNMTAVRKANVQAVEIAHVAQHTDPETYLYHLVLRFVSAYHIGYAGITFETDETLEGIQGKAATVLAALEEA